MSARPPNDVGDERACSLAECEGGPDHRAKRFSRVELSSRPVAHRRAGVLSLVVLTAATAVPSLGGQPPGSRVWAVPEEDVGIETLEERRREQERVVRTLEVFAGFRFEDRRQRSGIDFEHRVVDDGAKYYKLVHYDHGNGVVAADVDGDRLPDLYFPNQNGANELWRNLGDGRFENVTSRAGVGLAFRVSVAAAFGDLDNDGDPDLYVTTVKMGNVLFENRGAGRFRDRTTSSGLGYVGHSSAPVLFDYDNDGLLDVLLTNVGVYTGEERGAGGYYIGVADAFQGHLIPERTERTRLYRNLGDLRFADVTEEVGLVDDGWNGDAAFFDLDGDLDQDLYLLDMQGDDSFWRNESGRRFVEVTAEHFPKTPWGTMGVKAFDYDNDGDQDLLLTDMHSDMSEEVGPEREHLKSRMRWSEETLAGGENNVFGNAFFRNLGGGRFEEVSDRVGLENYWPWGVSVADVNADGWEDVLITSSMNFPFRYGFDSLKLNDRGERFVSAELALGVEPREEAKTDWFELDCAGGDREHRMCAGRDGHYQVRGNRGSRSAVIFDLDRDGDLDIVTAELNAAPRVLVSDLAARREVRFLAVHLVGRRSNRDGLGARVRVVAGGRTLVRVHDGKSGYLSQSSLPLYFGLGSSEEVDRVEVVWPSGARATVPGPLETNVLLEVVEPLPEPDP